MHGFQMFNANGEEILDEFPALYIQESGITKTISQLASDITPIIQSSVEVKARDFIADSLIAVNELTPFLEENPEQIRGAPAPLWPPTAMAFYRSSGGLECSVECYVGPTYSLDTTGRQQGLFFTASSSDFSRMEYIVVDTALGPLNGNYGMQIRNENGDITFDSRAGLFSIAEIVQVPTQTVQDIVYNGLVHDVTLSQPLPGCYMCCPYLTAFQIADRAVMNNYRDATRHRIRIRQISPNTLRLDRTSSDVTYRTRPQYAHDIFLFVARDPFA